MFIHARMFVSLQVAHAAGSPWCMDWHRQTVMDQSTATSCWSAVPVFCNSSKCMHACKFTQSYCFPMNNEIMVRQTFYPIWVGQFALQ